MAQLGTVLSSNTFLQWLSHANRAYQRLDAFASDDQALTANTINANVALNVTGTTSLTGANTNIQGGSLLVTSNANFTEGVQLQHGSLVIYTDTGSPSYIDMYCGTSNIHRVKLQAPQHANAIGAFTRVLTLPAANGTLLWGSSNTTHQSVTTNFTIEGNLTVNGNTTEFSANNITVNDPLIKLAANNEFSDTIDIGFVGHYYDGSLSQHAGLFRDASDSGTFKLFKTYAIEPNTALTIDTTDGSFSLGDLDVNTLDAQVITLAGANLATRLNSDLANTNSYIATNYATERAALANTNSYIATNYATERAALANTNSYIATKLATAGGTITGDVTFNDSVKAIFGAGSDLQIYHDGSNSYVQDTGTGDIIIKGDNVRLQDSTGGNLLVADSNDAVQLYYGYSQKLSTTATGVDIPSEMIQLSDAGTADRHIEIGAGRTGNGNSYVDLISDTTYTDYGARLIRYSTGANAATQLDHRGTGSLSLWARDAGTISIGTNNTERVHVTSAGDVGINISTPVSKLDITGSGAYSNRIIHVAGDINPTGYDSATSGARIGFTYGTVEVAGIRGGVTNGGAGSETAQLVFSTASSGTLSEKMRILAGGNVGIGTSSPARNLTVNGSIQIASGGVIEAGTTTLNTYIAGVEGASGRWAFATNGGERMRIDSSGNVGIGVTAPHSALEVNTVSTTPYQLVLGNVGQTSFLWGIGREGVTAGSLEFRSTGDGFSSSTVRMSLDTGGNLDVNGSVDANRYLSSTYTATTSGSVTLDFASYQNFVITLNGNITLANPSTEAAGQSGVIVFIQDGTGSRTCSVGTDYETADGGGITLSTTASRKDIIPYYVQASGSILLGRPTRNYS